MSLELSFNEYGAGPPLVVLHGLFGSKRNFSAIARRLADAFQVITVDLRNHGESPWDNRHDYPALAADVAQLIERQLGGPAAVIGHSMGGKAAMLLALTRPELVERLVVVDIPPARSRGTPIDYVHAMQAVPLAQLHAHTVGEILLFIEIEPVLDLQRVDGNLSAPIIFAIQMGVARAQLPTRRVSLSCSQHAFAVMVEEAEEKGRIFFAIGLLDINEPRVIEAIGIEQQDVVQLAHGARHEGGLFDLERFNDLFFLRLHLLTKGQVLTDKLAERGELWIDRVFFQPLGPLLSALEIAAGAFASRYRRHVSEERGLGQRLLWKEHASEVAFKHSIEDAAVKPFRQQRATQRERDQKTREIVAVWPVP